MSLNSEPGLWRRQVAQHQLPVRDWQVGLARCKIWCWSVANNFEAIAPIEDTEPHPSVNEVVVFGRKCRRLPDSCSWTWRRGCRVSGALAWAASFASFFTFLRTSFIRISDWWKTSDVPLMLRVWRHHSDHTGPVAFLSVLQKDLKRGGEARVFQNIFIYSDGSRGAPWGQRESVALAWDDCHWDNKASRWAASVS